MVAITVKQPFVVRVRLASFAIRAFAMQDARLSWWVHDDFVREHAAQRVR